MRLLPDRNFKNNFKKHYAENYEKIQSRLDKSAEDIAEKSAQLKEKRAARDPNALKNTIAGGIFFIVLVGSLFGIGVLISSKVSAQEREISELEYKISVENEKIRHYQVINGEEMHKQVTTAVRYVTKLQNIYLSQNFGDDFEVYSVRYLGDFDNDWSEGKEFVQPVWKGYVNGTGSFEDKASLVFVLYDGKKPVCIADVEYTLDIYGNLGSMSSVRKTWLA